MPRTQSFWQVTVTTTGGLIVPYNSRRSGLLIKNYSGNPVFISNDGSNISGAGFPLGVGDYAAFLRVNDDVPELGLYMQASGGSTDVRIVETFGDVSEIQKPAS